MDKLGLILINTRMEAFLLARLSLQEDCKRIILLTTELPMTVAEITTVSIMVEALLQTLLMEVAKLYL